MSKLNFVVEMQFSALKIWFENIISLSLHSNYKTVQVWKSFF